MQLPVELVSGVSKYEQSVRRAPAGVTVFSEADIKNYGWRTLADVLRNAPGIHIRSDRFYDYVGNRGFTRPYDYNSRTLILMDGHRLNESIYQQGAIGTDFILGLDMVERIEIIQGPGSSVYGSSAFYGAVNIIPKRVRDLAGGQVSTAVGSEPSVKARVSVRDRIANGVEYTVSATEWWSQGEDDFRLPQSWRDADPVNLTATRVSDQDQMHHQSAFANISWRGLGSEIAYVRRRKDVLPPVYFTNVDTEAYGIDERAYALLRAFGDPTPDSNLSAKLALDYYHYQGIFSPESLGYERHEFYADSLSLNTEICWRQTIAERHTLIAGVEYQENFHQNLGSRNLDRGASGSRIRESTSCVSPFAQLDWELRPDLWLSAGGRYDSYSTHDERFTEWPGDAGETAPFVVGVSADRELEDTLFRLRESQPIRGRRIRVIRLKTTRDLAECHAVYLDADISVREEPAPTLSEALAALSGRPLLTISAHPGFFAAGGMVNLYPEGGTLRFEIAPAAAAAAGLEFSSPLLALARIVRPAAP